MLQPAGASLQAAGPSLVERGERHAGNNFFQAVLRVNFPGITEHNGCDKQPANSAKYYCCWTHGYANDECAQYFNPPLTAFAFLTRSPYSWLVAMHSEPYEHDGVVPPSFSEFLRAPFSYTPSSYMSGPKDEQPNPVQLWAAKVDSYRSVTMPAANLTHLDLYDEEALTQRLAPLTAGGDFYQSPQERMLIEPVLAAAMNDKMDGSFSREEFNGAREYENGREWLQCAAPPRPPSVLSNPIRSFRRVCLHQPHHNAAASAVLTRSDSFLPEPSPDLCLVGAGVRSESFLPRTEGILFITGRLAFRSYVTLAIALQV